MKKAFLSAILLLILGMFLLVIIIGHKQKRDRFLIPEGYIGWIVVHYSVAGAVPLDMEDGFRLIKINANGQAITSSALIPGEGYYDEYFYLSSIGKKSKVPIKYFGAGGGTTGKLDAENNYTSICSFVWIGTKDHFEKMGKPDIGDKCK